LVGRSRSFSGEIEPSAGISGLTVEMRRVVSPGEAPGEVDATDPLSEFEQFRADAALGVVSFELDRGEVPESGVSPPRVVPAFDELEDRGASCGAGWPGLPVDPLFLRLVWEVSQTALSKQSPVLPIEIAIPALAHRLVNSTAVYCPSFPASIHRSAKARLGTYAYDERSALLLAPDPRPTAEVVLHDDDSALVSARSRTLVTGGEVLVALREQDSRACDQAPPRRSCGEVWCGYGRRASSAARRSLGSWAGVAAQLASRLRVSPVRLPGSAVKIAIRSPASAASSMTS
jgi:hypothetical protein